MTADHFLAAGPHIWLCAFEDLSKTLASENIGALLAPEEIHRWRQIASPNLRRKFELSHGFLRIVLSAYGAVPPAGIRYRYGSNGKPFLADSPPRIPGFQFNISHSDLWLAVGLSAGLEIGVDVEDAESLHRLGKEDLYGLSSVFSEEERHRLLELATEARLIETLRIWTLKEAVAKASGDGLFSRTNPFAAGEQQNIAHEKSDARNRSYTSMPVGKSSWLTCVVKGSVEHVTLIRSPGAYAAEQISDQIHAGRQIHTS